MRAHNWFSGIEWTKEELHKGTATSPFVGQCSKRIQELATADDGGSGSALLIERLGAITDQPPDQSLFEAFGTMHPYRG